MAGWVILPYLIILVLQVRGVGAGGGSSPPNIQIGGGGGGAEPPPPNI